MRAAMGGHELVVATSDSGDVFTFATGLGGVGGSRGYCARLGRPEDTEEGDEEGDEQAKDRRWKARTALVHTPTMLSRGKERGNQEGRAFHVSAVKDFFLVGWEAESAGLANPALQSTAALANSPIKSESPFTAESPQTCSTTRTCGSSVSTGAVMLDATAGAILAAYYY